VLRYTPFFAELSHGHPAASVVRDQLTPLVVLGDSVLIDDGFGHMTTIQPGQTFGKSGSSDAYDTWTRHFSARMLAMSR
jgi:hypothetical protein